MEFINEISIKLLLSSTVIANLLIAVVSILNTRSTNKRLMLIEKEKNNHEIYAIRYRELIDLSKEVACIPAFSLGNLKEAENVNKFMLSISNNFEISEDLYRKASPFLTDDYELENLHKEINDVKLKCSTDMEKDTLFHELIMKEIEFIQKLKVTIKENVKMLRN